MSDPVNLPPGFKFAPDMSAMCGGRGPDHCRKGASCRKHNACVYGARPRPTNEPRRIAEHVAEVTPQYRERARAWLNAKHTDMVEELATLLATISAECCP